MNRRELLAIGITALLPFGSNADARSRALTSKHIFDVRDYGAVGDGKTKDTLAIQGAIDAAAKAGGGTIYLGPGCYLCGGITLKSNITFYLDAGATLRGSTDLSDYPAHRGPPTHGDANTHHLIFASDAENITVCGQGSIDGQGRAFWMRSPHRQARLNYWRESVSNTFRPLPGNARPSPMLEFVRCRNLHIEGLTIGNSAGWTMRPIECESVFIQGIRVRNPIYGPNTDGMDITCCRNVFIANCDIATGDDALCIKSENPYGPTVGLTRNITVTNCVLSGCCNGFKIGTATHGAVENITFTNSVIYNDDGAPLNERIIAGVALEMVDGGSLSGIVISNIRMQNARTPIFVRLGNRGGKLPSGHKPGVLRGIMIDNVYATGAILTSSIMGLPSHHVEDIALSNIHIETAEGGAAAWMKRRVPEEPGHYPEASAFGRFPAYGLYCRHVSGLRLDNFRVATGKPDMRPLMTCDDANDVDVAGLTGIAPASREPLILLNDARHVFVHGCRAPLHVETFLTAAGGRSADISLVGNDLRAATFAWQKIEGAADTAVCGAGNLLRDG